MLYVYLSLFSGRDFTRDCSKLSLRNGFLVNPFSVHALYFIRIFTQYVHMQINNSIQHYNIKILLSCAFLYYEDCVIIIGLLYHARVIKSASYCSLLIIVLLSMFAGSLIQFICKVVLKLINRLIFGIVSMFRYP